QAYEPRYEVREQNRIAADDPDDRLHGRRVGAGEFVDAQQRHELSRQEKVEYEYEHQRRNVAHQFHVAAGDHPQEQVVRNPGEAHHDAYDGRGDDAVHGQAHGHDQSLDHEIQGPFAG